MAKLAVLTPKWISVFLSSPCFCKKACFRPILPYQPLVVSGLAYGADIWAHKQALEMGLTTVAVLPTSLDQIYPTAHKKIAMEMCGLRGGLLTEYPIGKWTGRPYFCGTQ